jgi:ABC-type uncharacterized transport system permease subunit
MSNVGGTLREIEPDFAQPIPRPPPGEPIPGKPAAGIWTNDGGGVPVISAVANTAKLVLINNSSILKPLTFRYRITVQSGNIDIGVYNTDFIKIWSRGSLACPAVGDVQTLIEDGSPTEFVLAPGSFYVAVVADNTTAAMVQSSFTIWEGRAFTSASAFPLPEEITNQVTHSGEVVMPTVGLFG